MVNNNEQKVLEEVHELEQLVNKSYEIFKNNHKDTNFDEFEVVLNDLKKRVIRNTMTNIVAVIDRVVENNSKNIDGENRQYNVGSIQIASDESLLLVTREVLGVDLVDKKYILDNHTTLIDFRDVVRIY